jgi:hypothetical protein
MLSYNEVANALEFPRQIGTTYAICQAALEMDAVVITHSLQEAARLTRDYEVDAVSFSQCVSMRGTMRASLIDNHAVWCIIHDMQGEIDKWKKEATLSAQVIKTIKNLIPKGTY